MAADRSIAPTMRIAKLGFGIAAEEMSHDLPDRYPPYQTCHRRFQQWQRDGTLTRLLHALAEDLGLRGKLDLSETFIDASFSSAKKGALLSARLAAEKAVKSWRSQTAMVFLSPAASPALRLMKRNLSKLPSSSALHEPSRNE
jgi:transposase